MLKALYLVTGVVLIAVGIVSLLTGGFTFTHQKNDVDDGPVQISHTATSKIPVAPIVSVVAVLAGGGLALAGIRMR